MSLVLQRDEALQLSGLLVAVQPIDEIDLNLRVKEAGLGEPIDQLLAKHSDVNRSGGDNTDLGAILGLVDLILRNLPERRPENERVDMNAAGIDEYVVGAPLDGFDRGTARRKSRVCRREREYPSTHSGLAAGYARQ